MKKRLLSLLLALCMTLALLSAAVTPGLAAEETLFERYIPIAQVYSAMATPTTANVGSNFLFQWGTQLVDENYTSAMFAKIINRKDYQGHFLKLGYLGTFGSMDKAAAMNALGLDDTAYQIAMGTQAPSGNYQKTIDKNSIMVTVDLYDANQKLVQNVSPACAILAVGPEGEFVTYSQRGGKRCSLFFSMQDNLCKITDDKKNGDSIHFTPTYTWLTDKSVADGLLGSGGSSAPAQSDYRFIQYPELSQERPQYMTNNILSSTEFIDPFGTYYQVGYGDGLDPVVRNKIENVTDYSEYGRVLSPGETQRSILTADGTLYGVNNLTCEKKVLATGVKQAGKAHYMTTDGAVKEIDSGKTVATGCTAFAEHRFAEVIGVLKTDGTLYLGYTYLSEAPGNYEKGLQKMTVDGGKTDKFKAVVACGAATEDERFFRWSETVTPMGYDEAAWAQGLFVPKNDYKLSLELVTDKAARVFPYEYFTEQESTSMDAVTGFVVSEDGYVWGFGLHRQFQLSDGKGNGVKMGMIKHIFPIYQTLGKFGDNANFVAFLSENGDKVKALMANHCTNNRPEAGDLPVGYLSDVPGGYKGVDGYTYCFDMEASKSFTMKPTAFHYLNDKREVFHAMNTSTSPISNMDLLPNVARSSYRADGKSSNVVLLERTDGSMWMTRTYSKVSAADSVAKLGGWENTNAIQITQPTNKVSGRCDYVDLVGGEGSTVVNRGPVDAPSAQPKTTFMVDPHYVNISEYQAEKKYRDGEKFVLLVCSLNCGWCKRLKAGLPATLKAAGYSVYGTSDDSGVLNFYWDFVKGNTVGTPFAVIVSGKNEVEVVSAIHSQGEMSAVIQKAKSKGIPSAVGTGSTTPITPETPATVLPIPADAQDKSGSKRLSKLSQTEMAALIKGAPDTLSEAPFQTQPSVSAPYATGQVKDSALQTAATRLTMLRRLAGLPAVELDAELSQQAQYGAVLLAASEFSHTPAQPADMSNDFYQKGYASTSTSNIHYSGTGGSTISTGSYVLAKSTDGFMDDSDMYNIDRVGHRRWQLNPTMKKVGFGLTVGKSGSWTNQYVAEQVMDTSGPAVDYDFISWPASGNFPNDLSGFSKDTAWSVTLNPKKYATPSAGAVSVKLTRLADGKVWTFSGSESYTAADSGKYFNVSTTGMGVDNCIIFRPDGITQYEGTYVVEVNGLTNSARQPATLKYGVIFFDSNNPDDSVPGVPAASTAPTSGTAYPSTQTVDLDGKKVEFQMYALRDAAGNPTNYVKVRDLALALGGTKAQFGVGWGGAVNLTAGSAYTPNGSENSTPFSGERAYTVPTSPTNVNGSASDLQAIVLTDDNGGGFTYYQLRDLGRKLGFNVDWSAERGVFIESDKPYSGK